MNKIKLSEILTDVCDKTTINNQYEVLTSSQDGIMSQEEYFKKQVASQDNTGYKIIRKGQFTYRSMSDTGLFFINRLDNRDIGIVSPAYPVFEISSSNVLSDYLCYFFKSNDFQRQISSLSAGSTRLALKYNKLCSLYLNVPSINKQKEIVSNLDTINNIIESDKRQLELLDEAVKSRFIEMFEFDKYTKLPLSELVFPKGKISYGIVVPGNKVESGIPMIRPLNFKNNYIDLTDLYVVSPSIEEKYCKTRLSGDEILVQVIGQPGRVMMTNNDCKGMNITRNLALISYNKEMISRYYLKCYLELDESQAFLLNQVNQATLAQLPLNRLKDLLIAVPEFDKQIEFEIFAKQIDKSKFNIQQHLNLMQELLDKKMDEFFGGE